MTLRVCVLILVLCSLVGASGATVKLDSLKVGSKTYTNVVVLGANASDLYFSHSQGFASVKLKYLEPDLQKRFHYNATAAAEFEREQSQNDALYQSTLASNIAKQTALELQKSKAPPPPEPLADPLSEKSPLGKPAPALNFAEWSSEKKPTLTGKHALAFFWSQNSPAAKKVISEMNAWQKKFPEKLIVFGVKPESGAVEASNGIKPEFVSAIDAKSAYAQALGVTSVPQVMLMDPNGVVVYLGHPAALNEARLQLILGP